MSDGVDMWADISELERAVIKYMADTGKGWKECLRKVGRIMAVSLATGTYPREEKQGAAAVSRDIRATSKGATDAYASMQVSGKEKADAFYAFFQDRKYKKAQGILDSSSSTLKGVPISKFDPALSRANKRKRGERIRPAQIVTSPRAREAYIKKKQRLVGFAKGAWANVARLLGGVRGIAQWVTRHRKSPGEIRENYSGDPQIELINNVDYIARVLSKSEEARAYRIGADRLEKETAMRLEKARQKAGL